MKHFNTTAKITAVIICAAASLVIGICVGSVSVSPLHIFAAVKNAFFGAPLPEDVPPSEVSIIAGIRLPRVVLSFIVGAAFSVSGAAVQSVLRNPLASPFTLGTSSGASLGASLVIVTGFSLFGSFSTAAGGAIFAVLTMFLMISFARRLDRSLQSSTVVLTGMVLSLFISAIVNLLANFSDEKYRQLMKWQNGSFAGRGFSYSAILLAFFAVCFIVFMIRSKELDLLTFGDEQAQSIGVNTARSKTVLLVLASVLSGTAVAFAGVIGFVDLIAPHVTRKIFGPRHKLLLPMTALVGGAFMTICDVAARTLTSPNELPVGVITSIIGAPFFAAVFFKRKR
ncbi:MAG: FecCD family ABC transporter permease [Oscillospiraceae bacterium]